MECASNNTGWCITLKFCGQLLNYTSEIKSATCDLSHIAQGGWTPLVIFEFEGVKPRVVIFGGAPAAT